VSSTGAIEAAGRLAALVVVASRLLTACGGSTDAVPVAGNGTAELHWVAPTQTTGGAPLHLIYGYNIYMGTSESELYRAAQIMDPTATSYTFHHLGSGTYYFSVAALGAGGEGTRTPPVAKTIR
jgi:hypothetical protein